MRKVSFAARIMSLSMGVLVMAGCGQSGTPTPPAPAAQKQQQPAPAPQPVRKQYPALPAMKIDMGKKYTAAVKTNKGDFTIELFPKEAPQTVNSFVFLARDGYYNAVRFHRVVKDFMIQTGDPTATGTGGPGYTVPDELPVKHKYDPGIVAMARTQAPNSGGSQFFICTGASCGGLNNDPKYVQFGRVVQGMDVVTQIASVPVGPSPSGEVSSPREDVYMVSIAISEG